MRGHDRICACTHFQRTNCCWRGGAGYLNDFFLAAGEQELLVFKVLQLRDVA